MQFQKDDIRESILAAARQEFWGKGFEKASIRNICRMAKTSTSNLYNYFRDKGALFSAVVEPTLSAMREGMEQLSARDRAENAAPYSIDAQSAVIVKIMAFVFSREADLKLLLFCSSGSPLAGFKDDVIHALSGILNSWANQISLAGHVPEFFTDMVASFYIGVMEQMLLKGISQEQAQEHFGAFLQFVYGGWSAVLNTNISY